MGKRRASDCASRVSPPSRGAPPLDVSRKNGTHNSAARPQAANAATEPASGRATKPARNRPEDSPPSDPAASTRPSDDPSRPGRASTANRARRGEGALMRTEAGKKGDDHTEQHAARSASAPLRRQAQGSSVTAPPGPPWPPEPPARCATQPTVPASARKPPSAFAERKPGKHGRDHRRPGHERGAEKRRKNAAGRDLVGEADPPTGSG